ncbi:prohibitin family protein [Helicobacter ailurogastricus]|uniref:Membrane protease family protein HP0248 n=1 Tax=Helicobacter ailurogastricus TaxID=1578720 RepID=A0A0K2X385_9HELI|nr:prohibitin family protein [Helicobacter ailurogastricus]CRF41395.1 Membrane protease family protein HP0248 [Helicobacter ailurogastricus]CRF41988.1 Membrane protease family protein HP0248 [Helicobacter ailurogastricus]CRF45001.1 Membrane protease family protein HP0248 [Helicobacter ailurogastricus]CRF53013.1 Membrane protease family protein HP0248 [Helicobacter ailurogastricus]BDQ28482.1 membrane protein [Helicobacter ailurogastricus]
MPIDLNEHLKKKQGNQPEPPKIPPKNNTPFKPPLGPNIWQSKKFTSLIVLFILVAVLFLAKPFMVIQSGEIGIKVTAGRYDPIPLQPGIHFFIPLVQDVLVIDTRVRTINFSRTEDMGIVGKNQGIFRNDAINVMDSRGLTVSIELTVQYRLNAQTTPQTIATYGLSWEQKIINPVVRDVVRSVVGRYPAEDLPIKRNEIAALINTDINKEVSKLPNAPVQLTSIQLREIVLPAKIKEQIEKVQIARQESERVKYEVEKAKQEAQKAAALAKGEADANRIKAQGIADAIVIEAKAKSAANVSIAQSLSDKLLSLRQIETQGQFNEALKTNQNAQIFLVPGGAVPNIWLDTHSRQKAMSAHK